MSLSTIKKLIKGSKYVRVTINERFFDEKKILSFPNTISHNL